MRRRGKLLSEAELALWRQVARTVKPLPGRSPVEPEPEAAQAKPAPIVENASPPAMLAPARPTKPVPPPLVPLERRMRTQLRRGQQGVEAVIDLHGLRQEEAHSALRGFLRLQQQRGAKLVLVVTGKGIAGDVPYGEERGILRRNVPHWLRLPDLRPLVLGFDEAEQRHGGAGALYIRLRRSRETG
ncbi:DNA-nicking endonuclease, Smr domain [Bosea sp. CRIB-10]|uniref:Smr/MutS family protein n=1 Tax=Bosea sp. CRIB-10 TaxID=378404 RepID=UPI0008EF45E7|nr:Smr/MutS family protein [Bosea sp. CRIB-10]SFD61016.1 DNA-nicking endonuclease, Smr domain [Bosea sp. CRIB-10]